MTPTLKALSNILKLKLNYIPDSTDNLILSFGSDKSIKFNAIIGLIRSLGFDNKFADFDQSSYRLYKGQALHCSDTAAAVDLLNQLQFIEGRTVRIGYKGDSALYLERVDDGIDIYDMTEHYAVLKGAVKLLGNYVGFKLNGFRFVYDCMYKADADSQKAYDRIKAYMHDQNYNMLENDDESESVESETNDRACVFGRINVPEDYPTILISVMDTTVKCILS